MKNKNFAVFILSFGRAEKVATYRTLKRQGYTGEIFIVCSTDDKTLPEYKKKYKDKVIVFDKNEIKKHFDTADNFSNDNVIFFARNAVWKIAKDLGVKYFLELDDDYTQIQYKIPQGDFLFARCVKNLDKIFDSFVNYLKSAPIDCIAFAQGGDFIGGAQNGFFDSDTTRRKIMNSFFNRTDKPYPFLGRLNEDVNCYTENAKKGKIFLTHPSIAIVQPTTQSNSGGMTESYLESGTYVKSFYSVLFNPSAVKIKVLNSAHSRLHHCVSWENMTPKIISPEFKK